MRKVRNKSSILTLLFSSAFCPSLFTVLCKSLRTPPVLLLFFTFIPQSLFKQSKMASLHKSAVICIPVFVCDSLSWPFYPVFPLKKWFLGCQPSLNIIPDQASLDLLDFFWTLKEETLTNFPDVSSTFWLHSNKVIVVITTVI